MDTPNPLRHQIQATLGTLSADWHPYRIVFLSLFCGLHAGEVETEMQPTSSIYDPRPSEEDDDEKSVIASLDPVATKLAEVQVSTP